MHCGSNLVWVQGKEVMPTSKETGHGGAGAVTVFGKKLREQRPWKVREIWFSRLFLAVQLPKKLLKSEVEK
jgi:hypothetical protein